MSEVLCDGGGYGGHRGGVDFVKELYGELRLSENGFMGMVDECLL